MFVQKRGVSWLFLTAQRPIREDSSESSRNPSDNIARSTREMRIKESRNGRGIWEEVDEWKIKQARLVLMECIAPR
jgi:hypothetical protein